MFTLGATWGRAGHIGATTRRVSGAPNTAGNAAPFQPIIDIYAKTTWAANAPLFSDRGAVFFIGAVLLVPDHPRHRGFD